jgi:probable O-glycosylation ligase (exosortase A-associated)
MRDILLAIVVFGMLPVCLMRPWIGILMWTWISMMNPQWLAYGFAREFPWAMVIGGVTIAGLVLTRDRKPVPWNGQLILMLLLLAYFAVTTFFFAWVPDVAQEKLTLVMKVMLMVILGTTVIYGRERIRWLLIVIALSIGFYGVKGGIWVAATGGENMVWGADGGFIQGNNAIGLALLMVVPLMLVLAHEDQRKWVRRCLHGAALLSCVSVVFTYSRGAMLGLAASAPFMVLRGRRKLIAVLVVVPIVAVGAMLAPEKVFNRAGTIATYEEDGSAMQRLLAWSVAWNIALERPLVGAGFDFYASPDNERWLSYGDRDLQRYSTISRAAHSIYFQVLGEHGFVAFGLYLLLLVTAFRKCTRLRKATVGNPELEWIGNYASAIRLCLIGYVVTGAFLSQAYFDLAWIYFSLPAILGREMALKTAHKRKFRHDRPSLAPLQPVLPGARRVPLADEEARTSPTF